jgi:hypothetical protein
MVTCNAKNVQSEDEVGGNDRPLPGRAHAIVNAAEETASEKKGTPGAKIEFTILKHVLPGQEGKTIPLFLSFVGGDESKTRKCLERVTRFALATGIINPGEEKELDIADAIGRELVIDIEESKYLDSKTGAEKSGVQLGYMGFWSLGNKAVEDVPKDTGSPGMMALLKQPAGNGNGNDGKPSQSQPAREMAGAGAAGGKSKWGDL